MLACTRRGRVSRPSIRLSEARFKRGFRHACEITTGTFDPRTTFGRPSPLRLLDRWNILTWWDFLYLGPRQSMWFSVFRFFFASFCFLCCYRSLRIFSIIADWRCPLTWWCLYDCHMLLPPFFTFFISNMPDFYTKIAGFFARYFIRYGILCQVFLLFVFAV